MSDQQTVEKVSVNIDGIDVLVAKGTNIIEAAAQVNIEIPHYCYHPKLSVPGNCRMCLVEMGMAMKDRATGEAILENDGTPKVGWIPRPAIACGTQAAPGMYIKTKSELAKSCQEGVMEFLLINHPLDCPICDQAGECRLQEFATDYGRGYSRFVEKKIVKPKRTVLGPRVILDDERCILCSRCIRFCQEIVHDDVLGFVDRGSYSTLTAYPGKQLDNNYSLNTVDICPVGALTSTDFRFKMRVWFLKRTNSICTESSVGVNTEVWSREGVIYRITPRRNDEVNDTWMTDSGRERYKLVEAENRLRKARSHGVAISLDEAHIRCAEILPTGKTVYIGSSQMSLEEQFLFKDLIAQHPGELYWLSHKEEGDGLLISSDRTPNLRGAFLTGLINDLPQDNLSNVSHLIDAGEIQNLFIYHEDVTRYGISEAQLKKLNVIYLGTHVNNTSEIARIVIPTLMVFEKSGTFVNQNFRLQKFVQAIPGPAGIMPDINTLNRIISLMKKENDTFSSIKLIWQQMQSNITQLKNLSFESIPDTGILLDYSVFNNIQFQERKTLHYEPKVLV